MLPLQQIEWKTELMLVRNEIEDEDYDYPIIIELTDNGLSYYGDLFQFLILKKGDEVLPDNFYLGNYNYDDEVETDDYQIKTIHEKGLQFPKSILIEEIKNVLEKNQS